MMALASRKEAQKIDTYIGGRLRRRRSMLGMSQSALADHLDISFQQVQKYENGTNRVSAGKLFQVAQYLKCEVSYFYEGVAEMLDMPPPAPANIDTNDVSEREKNEVLKAYTKLTPKILRHRFLELMRAACDG